MPVQVGPSNVQSNRRCSCSTQEYEKVESLNIDNTKEAVRSCVLTRTGEEIDIEEIEAGVYSSVRSAYAWRRCMLRPGR